MDDGSAREGRSQPAAKHDTSTIPRRPDMNAAARYDRAVQYIVRTVHCWHCIGAGWHARDVDLEVEHDRELGRAGYDAIGPDWAATVDRPTFPQLEERRRTVVERAS
jgi:hypothetical protein